MEESRCLAAERVTGDGGNFTFTRLAPGGYARAASRPGSQSATATVNVDQPKTAAVPPTALIPVPPLSADTSPPEM